MVPAVKSSGTPPDGLAQEHELVVTHGNGPQVGLLALQGEAYPQVAPYPLDVLGAESEDGRLRGVEAVIDKDRAAALLALGLGADALLLLTDVAGVELGHGTADAEAIARATPEELLALDLPAGSMGPKAEAAAWFVERTGGVAGIGALADAAAILAGDRGTTVLPAAVPGGWG